MANLVLPDRPLTLSRKARPASWGSIFLGLFLAVVGAFLIVWQLPPLLHDWTISRNPVVVYDGDVQNGKCTTRKGIFTDCEAHLVYDVNGTHYETDTALMFVDFHTGDYTVDLVRSGDDPSLATMSIGIEKLWNRIILLAVLAGFCVLGGLFLARSGVQARRAAARLSRPGKMQAVTVPVSSFAKRGKKLDVHFFDPTGRKPKAKYVSTFAKTEEPLVLNGPNGGNLALGVRHEATDRPVLLDRGLLRLNLTEQERQAALQGLGLA